MSPSLKLTTLSTDRSEILTVRLHILIPCLLLLGTLGCSAPEGQNAVTYLSAVTVQERRIETDARAIDNLVRQGQNGSADKKAVLEAVKKAKATALTGQDQIEKLNVPESTQAIHALYKQIFSLNVQQISLAEEILKDPQNPQSVEKRQKLTELKAQIEETEKKILEEKRQLSNKYQEVQLPEASPSSDSPAKN